MNPERRLPIDMDELKFFMENAINAACRGEDAKTRDIIIIECWGALAKSLPNHKNIEEVFTERGKK